jgi:hypothetical protein
MDPTFDIKGKVGAVKTSINQGIASAKSSLIGNAKAIARSAIKNALLGGTITETSSGLQIGDDFAGMQARGDAMQTTNWWCVLPTVGDVGFSATNGSQTLPWYYVQSSNLPFIELQSNSLVRNGRTIHLPESYSVADLNLTLFMDNTNAALRWYKAWINMVVSEPNPYDPNSQGLWGRPGDYKKNVDFVIYTYDDQNKKQLVNIKYINCMPGSQTSMPELNSGAPEVLTLSVGLKVEDIQITLLDASIADSLKSSTGQGLIGSLVTGATHAAQSQLNNIASLL